VVPLSYPVDQSIENGRLWRGRIKLTRSWIAEGRGLCRGLL